MAATSADDLFKVYFVCTGNRARSVLAESLFRRYADGVDAVVSSFGTLDVGSLPPLPGAVDAAQRLGADLRSHRSRTLRRGSLSRSDLVLGFEPAHLSAAVVDGGADIGRTFLLGELVANLPPAVVDADRVSRARFLVSVADSRRVRTRPDPAYAIADPYGMSPQAMQLVAEEIDRLVEALVHGLFGPAGSDAQHTAA
jgi:protein-tyrosine-phosphatase